jgi:hypothetical protein
MKVMFVGRNAVENCQPWPDFAVISLNDSVSSDGEAKIPDGWHSILRLSFDDVTEKTDPMGEFLTFMSAEDADRIVEFVHQVAPEVEGIIVHCRAGVSRSAAVAKWISGQFRIPFNRHYTKYNHHVYQLLIEAGQKKNRGKDAV